ncbi:MAG TPA: S41 family peptidase [Candidatus Aminicenantes bacterium]|nr:S41 family peptidase [Candidatus Aminicenantes bacterium]HPT00791.1 S41 family peptidase [Candidatus Aminicenantes bacterium]
MKTKVVFFSLLLVSFLSLTAQETRFVQYPDIRGDRLVFTYEGDLWTAGLDGSPALRITSHPGMEFSPKFSPDGKWIAFSGNYDQGVNVYLMPSGGGTPKRLTWRGYCQVLGWTPDGKRVLFRSDYENTFRPTERLYSVSLEGGSPEPLPVPRGVQLSISGDGSKMAYSPKGIEEYYWKRYKGGRYQNILLYDFPSKKFTPLTDYVGKNAYPMWIGETVYFLSDREKEGITNLYTLDPSTKATKQITQFTGFDVQMPSTDGQRIVFLQAGTLYVMETPANTYRKITVNIPTDGWKLATRTINPKEFIHSFSPLWKGEGALFEARGDIFIVAKEKSGEAKNLTCTPGIRERYPVLSPDGTTVAYFTDRTGDYQLALRRVDGGQESLLTTEMKTTPYHVEWSPDGKKLLFGTKEFNLFVLDIMTKKMTLVASSRQLKNDEFYWEVSDYTWSPDSRWIAYSTVQFNRNNQIFLYSLETGKSTPVTTDFYDSLNPSFDKNGECLYFLSYRNFETQLDLFEDNHVIPNPVQVMALQLRKGEKAFTPDSAKKPFRIDLEGLNDRIFPLPVPAGNYFYLKAGKGTVTWASVPSYLDGEQEELFKPKGREKWDLHIYDTASQRESVLSEKIADWRLSGDGESLLVQREKGYYTNPLGKSFAQKEPGSPLDLGGLRYTVVPREEWKQIFEDTWRWYRNFFYDPQMHGNDWKAIGDKFRAWLPSLTSRSDLNWLLSQMVGELCVSHTYVGGGDFAPSLRVDNPVFTGLLGAEMAADPSGYYRFKRLFGPTEYNRNLKAPLVSPEIELKEGDYLIAIDGHPVKTTDDPYSFLQVVKGQKVVVTVNSKPSPLNAKSYTVEPLRSESELRYERWIADNIAKVLKASDGRIGYMHITAMSDGNIAQFDKYWRAFRYKDGLVIDVRGNGGGWTEYFMIDKLERKMVAYNCLKEMEPFRYPGSVSNGKYAVLSNERNGSDGEAFVEHFKARKLGTVVGVPSWGGLVGIVNSQITMDNGFVEQSNNSFYNREGKWLVENHGADPDVLVENDPESELAGVDKQLETAIELLKKQIQEDPFTFPGKPPYSKR